MKSPLLALLVLAGTAVPAPAQELDQQELERLTAAIQKDIEALRGRSFPRPVAVSVADKARFLEYARARLEKTSSPEDVAAEETVAKLLGLVPPDMDLLATYLALVEEQVGGFYDPDTESFCLMDSFTGGLAKVILAHELTHALDDQLYDIDGTLEGFEDHSDRQVAYHGVVEGSGTAVMGAWTIQNMSEVQGADLSQVSSLGGAGTAAAPPFLWRPLMAVYMKGAAFLNRTDNLMAGQMQLPAAADFERAFADPPLSTEQLLHPAKYWDPAQRDDPVPVAFELGTLPKGWEVITEDTLGELGIASWVEPVADRGGLPTSQLAILAVKFTFPAAEGWGGDRYVLLGKDDQRVLVVETRWDTDWDAGEFFATLTALQGHLEANVEAVADRLELRKHGVEIVADRARRAVSYRAWITSSSRDRRKVLEAVGVRD